ncbi:hypothetical protein QBC35DRAFT_350199, partial [Podospora australis]
TIGTQVKNQLGRLLGLSRGAVQSIRHHRLTKPLLTLGMYSRHENVAVAHSETFGWIFDAEHVNRHEKALKGRMLFRSWLESGSGTFHIAAKPGAGKSTLMKFLAQHVKTRCLLKTWANGQKVVICKFFFWKPGPEALNSINAMIRMLLYEALEQCPELAQDVLPQLAATAGNLDISHCPVLQDMDFQHVFQLLLSQRNKGGIQRKFYVFIDGLDEYKETPQHTYKHLIALLLSWVDYAAGDFKICVSSREYDVCLDGFSSRVGIRLQDLTHDDMTNYVGSIRNRNQNFVDLEKPEGGAQSLIRDVVEKSSGVFLWVSLVAKLLDDASDDGNPFQTL